MLLQQCRVQHNSDSTDIDTDQVKLPYSEGICLIELISTTVSGQLIKYYITQLNYIIFLSFHKVTPEYRLYGCLKTINPGCMRALGRTTQLKFW